MQKPDRALNIQVLKPWPSQSKKMFPFLYFVSYGRNVEHKNEKYTTITTRKHALRVGVGGSKCSDKTASLERLCKKLRVSGTKGRSLLIASSV